MSSTLEREMERMGWTKQTPPPLPRTISRRLLDEQRRADAAREEAAEAHRAAIAAIRAAKAAKEAPRSKIVPKRAWIGYSVGAGVVVLLAAVVSVVLARANLRTSTLQEQQQSKATLLCTDGNGVAANGENLWTWLTGGHSFQCTNWETLDTKRERDRAADEARAQAKEAAARRAAGYEQS
jgi:hypothetical protein